MGVVAGVGINLGFAIFPVLVAHLVVYAGWQWAFTLAIVPCLIIVGLATMFQPNIRSGESLEAIAGPGGSGQAGRS